MVENFCSWGWWWYGYQILNAIPSVEELHGSSWRREMLTKLYSGYFLGQLIGHQLCEFLAKRVFWNPVHDIQYHRLAYCVGNKGSRAELYSLDFCFRAS